jgi:hypothetical protein
MKKSLLIITLLALTSCTSKNEYGECVGLNGGEQPGLNYKYSAWNIGVGLFFSGLLVPPIVVALDGLKCPSGPKTQE